MNKNLIETVESLGGTALMGGILIQFSDTTFAEAVKKIYEMGASAEREACAKIVLNEAYQYTSPVWAFEIVNDIRARGQA